MLNLVYLFKSAIEALGFGLVVALLLVVVGVPVLIFKDRLTLLYVKKYYKVVNVVPEWITLQAECNKTIKLYKGDNLLGAYRDGFKFFKGNHYKYAVFFNGLGGYTVYSKQK